MEADKKITEVETEVSNPKKSAKDKNACVTRVFRQVKPMVMRNKGLVTFMSTASVIDGLKIPGQFIELTPNHASQYVLTDGALHYAEQLKVLRAFEEAGEIVEVDPKTLGTPFISEEEKELAVIEKRAADLRKAIGIG